MCDGVEVERSPRMREIGVRSPVGTYLSRSLKKVVRTPLIWRNDVHLRYMARENILIDIHQLWLSPPLLFS